MSDDGEGAANAVSKTQIEGFMSEAKHYLDELAALRSDYMNACKAPREGLAGVRDAAKEAGVPRKVFNELVKEMEDERKKEARLAKLDEDLKDQLDDLRLKLGRFAETPLGQAALDEVDRDLRPDFLRKKVA